MPAEKFNLSFRARATYYLTSLFLKGLIGTARLLPYTWRIPAMGWVAAHVLAPLAGFDKRVRDNLKLALPDLPEKQVKSLCRAVPDSAGRYLMEVFSGRPFIERARKATVTGPGYAALQEAHTAKRPVIMVTGHFGSYDAARACLIGRGFNMGVLYRRMANPYYNDYYVRAMSTIGLPMFEQGRRGMMEMVRHLKDGGIIAIVADLHAHGGKELQFFGQPAVTSIVTAELALKYDAVLIPAYGVRQPNGLDFEVVLNTPIPHSDPETMMQAVNDDLEEMVRQHPDQWFWIHRRWKPWYGLGVQPASDDT